MDCYWNWSLRDVVSRTCFKWLESHLYGIDGNSRQWGMRAPVSGCLTEQRLPLIRSNLGLPESVFHQVPD